jgi:alpha-1,2-mannosyltransferase
MSPLLARALQLLSSAFSRALFAAALCAALLLVAVTACSSALRCALAWRRRSQSAAAGCAGGAVVAFFHPYAAGGGGGERVLACALAALARRASAAAAAARSARAPPPPPLRLVVYVAAGAGAADAAALLGGFRTRFGVDVPLDGAARLELVPLRSAPALEARRYPVLTLAGQALGAAAVALECVLRAPPHVFFDTTGHAAACAVAKLAAGAGCAAYVHYPTVSLDMLEAVAARRAAHNNGGRIAASAAATAAKLAYYRLFAACYRAAGGAADVVMVNSLWTRAHVQQLWLLAGAPAPAAAAAAPAADARAASSWLAAAAAAGARAAGAGAAATTAAGAIASGDFDSPALTHRPAAGVLAALARMLGAVADAADGCADHGRPAARVVYPPCNTDALAALPLRWQAAARAGGAVTGRSRVVVSVGQFRPEKDHALQVRAFAAFAARDAAAFADVRLLLIGGVRDAGDAARLAAVRALAADLGVAGRVDVLVNAPLAALRAALADATAGLHTMWNEHFGIGVVEMMAAGVLVVAHASGGPAADIVRPHAGVATGFLAATADEYADALEAIFRAAAGGGGGCGGGGRVELDAVAMATAARASVARFSDAAFDTAWRAATDDLVDDAHKRAAADAAAPRAAEAAATVAQRRRTVD